MSCQQCERLVEGNECRVSGTGLCGENISGCGAGNGCGKDAGCSSGGCRHGKGRCNLENCGIDIKELIEKINKAVLLDKKGDTRAIVKNNKEA